jgi:sucrose phosphorylase
VHEVATRFRRLVRRRIAVPAFHPNAAQEVLTLSDAIFALRRASADGASLVVALVNVTAEEQPAALSRAQLGALRSEWRDLVSGRVFAARGGQLALRLAAYEVLWLVPDGDAVPAA